MAIVALLRDPFGLPELPDENWPAVFLPFFILLTYHNETPIDRTTVNSQADKSV